MSDVLNRAIYQYSRLTAPEQQRLAATAIKSGRLSSLDGPYVREYEQQAARYLNRAHAIATSSATAALELALRALGIGAGHQVVISELGWVSVGAAVTATGANVVVAPIAAGLAPTWAQIEPLIGPASKAVILPHMRGMLAPDVPRIATELGRAGITLIEDCAQAWGVPTAGAHGHVAVFSTQQWKLIATGEGGLALTDDAELALSMRALSGNSRIRTDRPCWRSNARMPEIAAALAIPQLAHLDQLLAQLRALRQRIIDVIVGFDIQAPANSNGSIVGLWGERAAELADHLFREGISCWSVREGDLHHAAAWPVRPVRSVVDLRRYLSVAVPYLPIEDHAEFGDLLADAIAKNRR